MPNHGELVALATVLDIGTPRGLEIGAWPATWRIMEGDMQSLWSCGICELIMATDQEIEIAARALCRARNLNPDIIGLDGKTPIWAGPLKDQARLVLETVEAFRRKERGTE